LRKRLTPSPELVEGAPLDKKEDKPEDNVDNVEDIDSDESDHYEGEDCSSYL